MDLQAQLQLFSMSTPRGHARPNPDQYSLNLIGLGDEAWNILTFQEDLRPKHEDPKVRPRTKLNVKLQRLKRFIRREETRNR